MTPFQESLRARAAESPRRIAFPEVGDERIDEAVAFLAKERLVEPVPVGASGVDPEDDLDLYAGRLVERRAHKGMTLEEAREHARDPVMRAGLMVGMGEVDGSVAGAAHPTPHIIRASLWCVGTAPGVSTLSSCFFMALPDLRGEGPAVLTYTDAGVVPDPDAQQLSEIAASGVASHEAVVGDAARVAFLSYSTRGSASGPSVDRVREALALFRERCPDTPVDGELQVDAALVPSVARSKAPGSPVDGRANVLVFPDLDAGNIGYKLTQYLAGAQAIGPFLQGFARPVCDLSRGATVDDITAAAAIALLQAASETG